LQLRRAVFIRGYPSSIGLFWFEDMADHSQPPVPCHVCGSTAIRTLSEYARFHRVTSDCKPWKPGGKLGVCSDCGVAQAVLDPKWHDEAKQIYEAYTIYHQSKGVEQSVFDQASGQATSRSTRLLRRLLQEIELPVNGRLMDIGCGNGALLRAFSGSVAGWTLAGLEVNDHYRSTVESIDRVERLYTGSPEEVPGQFDAISLMHALEHIPSPREFLSQLWGKLKVGGFILIQVPDCAANPFMFLVADHSSHFFLPILKELVQSAGYEVKVAVNDWVAKELTIVAYKTTPEIKTRNMVAVTETAAQVTRRLDWLASLVQTTRQLLGSSQIGVFGTSIAATWLFAELEGQVDFFVDEDPARIGSSHLGRPIHGSSRIPPGSQVFLALPPFLAQSVAERIRRPGIGLHWPAPLPE
jgi:2-polyprenyl-3-methyl-5-hydroxy-6-metoxy-1,4-benzoquinol methylase